MDSGKHATNHNPSILKRFFGILIMIVVVLAATWGIRTYILEPFQIPSASMEQTIQTGDRVFAEKVTYLAGEPQPGDIVVFSDPQVPSRILIKRVIATEGQVIDFQDGKVLIDGVVQDEPYTDGAPTYPLTTASNVSLAYPYTVPQGMVWVMGDNRLNSADSRYFGPINESTVFGRAFVTYWPLDHFGLLE